jgi:hypothetical protein
VGHTDEDAVALHTRIQELELQLAEARLQLVDQATRNEEVRSTQTDLNISSQATTKNPEAPAPQRLLAPAKQSPRHRACLLQESHLAASANASDASENASSSSLRSRLSFHAPRLSLFTSKRKAASPSVTTDDAKS